MLSLVIPLYKTDLIYLEELLHPLRKYLDCGDLEVILVNDQPTNITLSRYLAILNGEMPNVVVIHNEQNLGSFKSYCRGFLAASHPYVGILDHDDLLFPGVIVERLKSQINRGLPVDLLYTDEATFEKWWTPRRFVKPQFDQLSSIYHFYPHHLTAFRTEIAQACVRSRPEGIRTAFDIWLMSRYLLCFGDKEMVTQKISYIAYYWRMHADSTAGNQSQKPELVSERLRIASDFFKESGERLIDISAPKNRALVKPTFDLEGTLDDLAKSGYTVTRRFNWLSKRKLRHVPINYIAHLPYSSIQFVPRNKLSKAQIARIRHERDVPYASKIIQPNHPHHVLLLINNARNQSAAQFTVVF